ncbi:hypothetical protein Nepgr_006810 [Nepenthes gracilis]|uniref:Uncharacterized protein n=1 Tax=Nepenthes gracilis TaxID=150966 RepID=A0AAD3S637_NEPGR|nr:hypothetical protein Nepgr_006810 [Nepenthes gracilis]
MRSFGPAEDAAGILCQEVSAAGYEILLDLFLRALLMAADAGNAEPGSLDLADAGIAAAPEVVGFAASVEWGAGLNAAHEMLLRLGPCIAVGPSVELAPDGATVDCCDAGKWLSNAFSCSYATGIGMVATRIFIAGVMHIHCRSGHVYFETRVPSVHKNAGVACAMRNLTRVSRERTISSL